MKFIIFFPNRVDKSKNLRYRCVVKQTGKSILVTSTLTYDFLLPPEKFGNWVENVAFLYWLQHAYLLFSKSTKELMYVQSVILAKMEITQVCSNETGQKSPLYATSRCQVQPPTIHYIYIQSGLNEDSLYTHYLCIGTVRFCQ